MIPAISISGPLCPHHPKCEPVGADGCPQCAAPSLADGVGPLRSTAGGEEEKTAAEESDREAAPREGKKGPDGAGARVGCSPRTLCKELWHKMRKKLWGIVESKYFNRGIMIAILINTISMGIEHHEQVPATGCGFPFHNAGLTQAVFSFNSSPRFPSLPRALCLSINIPGSRYTIAHSRLPPPQWWVVSHVRGG